MDLTPLEINQIANLVDINVIRKLGLHLGLAHAEIQRYEKTNNQNPSQCTGTEDMLVAWHRNGGTREMLCRALGVVEQTRLAFRIESGEFRAEPVAAVPVAAVPLRPNSTSRIQTTTEPEAALHAHVGSTNLYRPLRSGRVAERVNIEYVIPRLAEDITNSCVGKLGQALNFRPSQINRYESTNHMSGRVTVKGTISMLYDWKSRTSVRVQKEELRAALIQVGMIEIAEEHLPLEDYTLGGRARLAYAEAAQALTGQGATTEAEKSDDDSLLEKVQSDGADSVETIDHALDGRSATGKIGAPGGKLSTKSHGLTLHIPPGALEGDVKISLIVLTDIPEGLTLNKDELLVSHGFQCYPSGLHFKKPAKLIIPHCALVTAPNNLKTILYSWNQSGIPKRLSDPDNIICSVQERWLEVSINHFSGGFIALIRNMLFLKGILLSCMSFLPRFMPPSRKPILEVRFVKKPHGEKWKDVHTLDDRGFQPVKGDDDDIVLWRGTIKKVTCQLGEKGPKLDLPAIQDSDMRLNTKVTGYIMLDLTKESDETLVTLEVVKTSTQTIKFNTRFQARIGERFTEQDTPSPSNVEIPSGGQKVTDANILKLARLLPPNLWSPLYVALSIDYSIAEGIREKSTEIPEQYIHLLQKWIAASTRTRNDLNAILIQVEAGGLVDKYMD